MTETKYEVSRSSGKPLAIVCSFKARQFDALGGDLGRGPAPALVYVYQTLNHEEAVLRARRQPDGIVTRVETTRTAETR